MQMMKQALLAFAVASATVCGAADIVTLVKANKLNDPVEGDPTRYAFYEQAKPNSEEVFMFQICDCSGVRLTENGEVAFKMDKVSSIRLHSALDKKPFFGKKAKASMTVVSDKDAQVALFMEGGINGNHFWRAKDYSLKAGQPTNMELTEALLPEDAKATDGVKDMSLWLRFDVRTPGAEITIQKANITTVD